MNSLHVKKGDEVVVLAGSAKGKRGRIISIVGKKECALVEGVRMITKHKKPKAANQPGEIVKQEGAIHLSNLMNAAEFDARAAKHGTATPAKA
jgi:large subunit ribosomal protein L24